jgi:phosphoserine phosphatase RsbU/P
MLPRTPGLLVLFTFLWASSAGFVCRAEQSQPVPPVRYHFGDNANSGAPWADPNFDDSSWPIAQGGRWPMPAFYSDGFVWVRVRVPVRSDAMGPLAVHITENSLLGSSSFPVADEAYVNGLSVGHRGSFPPHAEISFSALDFVSNLPVGVAVQGPTAVVALRVWYPPIMRGPRSFASAGFDIDESRFLHLAAYAGHVTSLLAIGPDLALNVFIASMGVGLLVLWRWTGGRELLLCSGMLIAYPAYDLFGELSGLGLVVTSWRVGSLIATALTLAAMAVTVEFVWTTHVLRVLGIKRLLQAAMAIFNGALLFGTLATAPSPILLGSLMALVPSALLYSFIAIGVNLWALFFVKGNRLIAAALLLIPIAVILGLLGAQWGGTIGPFRVFFFSLAFFLSALALFVMLGQRAWQAWRARDELRVEFEAAREVQQQLVAPAVDVPGFRIESVYAPATQVGGDFFRIVPEGDGGVLVVVGDVSGKGLRAAMTVSALIGTLRTIPLVSPGWILNALNSGLAGNLHGGFVTCCAARITHDGRVTIANAGHLSPYRNGFEVEVGAGLPLGIDPMCEYEESPFLLPLAERLTFVSDGVVEARNASGELFGFERTLAISNQPANAIAEAARQFGQEDDITVLSVTRTAATEPALA